MDVLKQVSPSTMPRARQSVAERVVQRENVKTFAVLSALRAGKVHGK